MMYMKMNIDHGGVPMIYKTNYHNMTIMSQNN